MKSGVLMLDKPKGITSYKVVERVKRCLKVKKAGHTGTLDPMATGLVVVCIGKATKIARFLTEADKVYQGRITLGVETDTFDTDGKVVSTAKVPASLTLEDIQHVVDSFTGTIYQVPPAYSAAKHKGVPLYKLARRGVSIKKEPKKVCIYRFQITNYDAPHFEFLVHCSKGTYIRSLANDIGRTIGCGATLSGLRRLRSGLLSVEKAIPFQSIEDMDVGKIKDNIMPVELVLSHIPSIIVETKDALYIQQGRGMRLSRVFDYMNEQISGLQSVRSDYLRVMAEDNEGKLRLICIAKWPDFAKDAKLEILRVWSPN